jgi:hypothetical protein
MTRIGSSIPEHDKHPGAAHVFASCAASNGLKQRDRPAASAVGRKTSMEESGSRGHLEESLSRSEQIVRLSVRAVSSEMAGQPVDRVFRALNARLHASGVARDSEEVWEYADSISAGAPPDLGAERL